MSFRGIESSILEQAKNNVYGFRDAYESFIERITLDQSSESMIINYSRSIAHAALHFGKVPHIVEIEDINTYLYQITLKDKLSSSYFKQSVYGLRFWFRLFGQEGKALQMPVIRHTHVLPTVLSKEECKELFKAPRLLKHRFLLALAYSAGLRMNELRLLKISDVDLDRKQIHVRQGKGKKDRYVVLSNLIASKFQYYLTELNPQVYVFEGQIPCDPLGKRSIQYVINEALQRTKIKKAVSMHTLRHSFATHLLEDGIDLQSIQRLLGHSDIRTTLEYIHVARIKTKEAHSPLDSLYNLI